MENFEICEEVLEKTWEEVLENIDDYDIDEILAWFEN